MSTSQFKIIIIEKNAGMSKTMGESSQGDTACWHDDWNTRVRGAFFVMWVQRAALTTSNMDTVFSLHIIKDSNNEITSGSNQEQNQKKRERVVRTWKLNLLRLAPRKQEVAPEKNRAVVRKQPAHVLPLNILFLYLIAPSGIGSFLSVLMQGTFLTHAEESAWVKFKKWWRKQNKYSNRRIVAEGNVPCIIGMTLVQGIRVALCDFQREKNAYLKNNTEIRGQ